MTRCVLWLQGKTCRSFFSMYKAGFGPREGTSCLCLLDEDYDLSCGQRGVNAFAVYQLEADPSNPNCFGPSWHVAGERQSCDTACAVRGGKCNGPWMRAVLALRPGVDYTNSLNVGGMQSNQIKGVFNSGSLSMLPRIQPTAGWRWGASALDSWSEARMYPDKRKQTSFSRCDGTSTTNHYLRLCACDGAKAPTKVQSPSRPRYGLVEIDFASLAADADTGVQFWANKCKQIPKDSVYIKLEVDGKPVKTTDYFMPRKGWDFCAMLTNGMLSSGDFRTGYSYDEKPRPGFAWASKAEGPWTLPAPWVISLATTLVPQY